MHIPVVSVTASQPDFQPINPPTTVVRHLRFSRESDMWQRTHRFIPAMAAIAISLFTSLPARAQVSNTWVYDKGSFLKTRSGSWQELYMGRETYKFQEVARNANTVVLFDQSRGITVKLVEGTAEISSGDVRLNAYVGRFFFNEWTYDGGKFVNKGGKNWQEFQDGRLAFSFQQVGERTTNSVTLYDASRDVRVKLAPGRATVSEAEEERAGISGNWSQ
jgi:hypothetical protein